MSCIPSSAYVSSRAVLKPLLHRAGPEDTLTQLPIYANQLWIHSFNGPNKAPLLCANPIMP